MKPANQTVNFLEVAKGLQEGYVYRHSTFGKDEYVVLNAFDEIKRFDGLRALTDPELTSEQVLSDAWEPCDKQIWYLLGIEQQETLDIYEADNGDFDYILAIEDKDHYLPWETFPMAEDELSEYQRFIAFKIAKNAHLSDEEKEIFGQKIEQK